MKLTRQSRWMLVPVTLVLLLGCRTDGAEEGQGRDTSRPADSGAAVASDRALATSSSDEPQDASSGDTVTDGARAADTRSDGAPESPTAPGDSMPSTVTPSQGTEVQAPRRGTRVAPYDYGCLYEPNCEVQDSDARNGKLKVVQHTKPCMYYAPPFAGPCFDYSSSYAGIGLDLGESRRRVRQVYGSAVVHIDRSVPAVDLKVCLNLIDEKSTDGYFDSECRPVPAEGNVTVDAAFDVTGFNTRVAGFYVSLIGDGAAIVDRISYELH